MLPHWDKSVDVGGGGGALKAPDSSLPEDVEAENQPTESARSVTVRLSSSLWGMVDLLYERVWIELVAVQRLPPSAICNSLTKVGQLQAMSTLHI